MNLQIIFSFGSREKKHVKRILFLLKIIICVLHKPLNVPGHLIMWMREPAAELLFSAHSRCLAYLIAVNIFSLMTRCIMRQPAICASVYIEASRREQTILHLNIRLIIRLVIYLSLGIFRLFFLRTVYSSFSFSSEFKIYFYLAQGIKVLMHCVNWGRWNRHDNKHNFYLENS